MKVNSPTTLVRETRNLLREEQKIRLAIVLVVFLFLLTGQDMMTRPGSLAAIVCALAFSVAGLVFSYCSRARLRQLGAQQLQIGAVALALLDLAMVTLLAYGSGGLNTPFFLFYVLSLIFVATFFRGLELAFMTLLAALLFLGVSRNELGAGLAPTWSYLGRMITLILIAWYAFVVASVMHREKEANDQLLRHLAEGVMLFNSERRVTLVNALMLSLLGMDESALLHRTQEELAKRSSLLSWLLAEVGVPLGEAKTRTGSFPEADLPLIECTTIPCGRDGELVGWLLVVKDLRDQLMVGGRTQGVGDKLVPLSNLRALTEALYGLARYLDEQRRWSVMETIERHTRALQVLLAELLHGTEEHAEPLELEFVEISSLLSATRRLLEIQPGGPGREVEIFIQQGMAPLNADRARLGHFLLQLCRALLAVAQKDEKLVIDVRPRDEMAVFTLELVNETQPEAPLQVAPEAQARFGELTELPLFSIIEEHHGRWLVRPESSGYRRLVFELPFAGPGCSLAAAEAQPEETQPAELAPIPEKRPAPYGLTPALAAELVNQLKNILSIIRGYAEMALGSGEEQRLRDTLQHAITLCDEAAQVVENLQPSLEKFEPPAPEIAPVTELPSPRAPAAAPSGRHILIVDDDIEMRQFLANLLREAGYEVAEAVDGPSAVEHIRLHTPAMALVDLSMPRVTGVEVMRETRQYAPDLPIVLMTGYSLPVALRALGDEKPYALLSKPFSVDEVLRLARAVLGEPTNLSSR